MAERVPDEIARANWRWLTLLIAFLAALAVGCYDRIYSFDARALCPGIDVDRVRAALTADTTMETRPIDLDRPAQSDRRTIATFWSTRAGITAEVHVSRDPDELEVVVGRIAPPKAQEFPRWKAQVEYVCALLSREIPQVQEWSFEDHTGQDWFSSLPIAGLAGSTVLAGGAALTLWIIVRKSGLRRHA
jgi:hypothetical protein